jgi:hypothetical protein
MFSGLGLFVLNKVIDQLKHHIYHYSTFLNPIANNLSQKNKLLIELMARKAAYVEDCPEEDNGDTDFIIPPSQKKVNFAVKLPRNRENDSTLDSGYQSLTGGKKPGKENNASHRVEIKIENHGKKLGRERSFKDSGTTKKHVKEKIRLYPVQDGPRLSMSGSGPPRVTINDTRFMKYNGNLRGYHSPCECQGCQEGYTLRAFQLLSCKS